MNKTSERLTELFDLHCAQQASELDQQELWDYIDDPAFSHEINALLANAFLKQTDEHSLSQSQADSLLQQIFHSTEPVQKTAKRRSLWPMARIAAAAAAVLLSAGLWFYQAREHERQQEFAIAQIAPGRNVATLTLANGKKIRLTNAKNGELAREAGLSISKTSQGMLVYRASGSTTANPTATTGQYNTLSTGKGETFQVQLPDGSLVSLNAASSLTYPTGLASAAERRVELSGEGYFEVVKLTRQSAGENGSGTTVPFIVSTDRQQVEVLGTHFNINSYADEKEVKTTLLEGKVRVSASHTTVPAQAMLHPNQQSSWSGSEMTVRQVNAEDAIAWKNGLFRFEDASVETVLRQFARWYNLEVVYTGKMPDRSFTGELYRNLSFAEALKIMDFAKVKFKIQGNKLIVSP